MIGKTSTARQLLRAANTQSHALQTCVNSRRCASTWNQHVRRVKAPSDTDLDGAEPGYRYGISSFGRHGYLPVHLGDKFQEGRYTVLHKLGWGRFSTVWAAKDNREQRYVALKISTVANKGSPMAARGQREKYYMSQRVSDENPANQRLETGWDRLSDVYDHFGLQGFHGNHDCFVVELQGQTVSDFLEQRKREDEMLSGQLVRRITKDTLLGLRALHNEEIAHGDIRIHNVAFALPPINHLSEEEFCQKLGEKKVKQKWISTLVLAERRFPEYLVRPCEFSKELSSQRSSVKIFDFGETFKRWNRPNTLLSPRMCQAPEVVSSKRAMDYRVDMWSMGCMLFEMVAGQPLFDGNIDDKPGSHMRDILDTLPDQELPNHWRHRWIDTIDLEPSQEPSQKPSDRTLQTRLEEIYFADEKKRDMSRNDIAKIAELAGKMLRIEPAERASADEILKDPWLADVE